jgi:hypothetical protein
MSRKAAIENENAVQTRSPIKVRQSNDASKSTARLLSQLAQCRRRLQDAENVIIALLVPRMVSHKVRLDTNIGPV